MKVTIYGKPDCPLCVRSKALVQERGVDFEYIDFIEAGLSKADLEMIVGGPVRTAPQILIDGKAIGGYPQLIGHLNKERTEQAKESVDLSEFDNLVPA